MKHSMLFEDFADRFRELSKVGSAAIALLQQSYTDTGGTNSYARSFMV
jgi:hypothetical protein